MNGREVIEIKQVGDDNISEFWVIDENDHLIASIENCPVIVDWRTISIHDQQKMTRSNGSYLVPNFKL